MADPLKLSILAGHPLVSVQTFDEERAVQLVRQTAAELCTPLVEWSATMGFWSAHPSFGAHEKGVEDAAAALRAVRDWKFESRIYVFRDLGPHCRDPVAHRLLRDLHSRTNLTLILVDSAPLPENIRRLAVPVVIPPPTPAELEQVVRDTFQQVQHKTGRKLTATLTRRDMDVLVQTLRGLTLAEASRVVASAVHSDGALSARDVPLIVEAKRNLLQSAGSLESVAVNVGIDEIAGLGNLKRWLKTRRGGMTQEARAFGLDHPRGILLLGVQGCGKSLCAKAVAADWNMPLLRMDPGVLYQKFIGESENRLREALAQAEAMAPVILWVDEIEKAFASAGSESADGGLSQRMFGTLLTWMQDHRSSIFLVATANNVQSLPPELLRKGRFDEVFFVDLPADDIRKQIFAVHLKKRGRDPAKFGLDELAVAAEGFSGAEIEQAVVAALYAAFAEKVELATRHLMAEVRTTRPLSVLMEEKVSHLRVWARGRCVMAD